MAVLTTLHLICFDVAEPTLRTAGLKEVHLPPASLGVPFLPNMLSFGCFSPSLSTLNSNAAHGRHPLLLRQPPCSEQESERKNLCLFLSLHLLSGANSFEEENRGSSWAVQPRDDQNSSGTSPQGWELPPHAQLSGGQGQGYPPADDRQPSAYD